MFFSVITMNLNWEILTKNLVTFKRWDGVKDENFVILWGSLKNSIFREVHEKPIYWGGDCQKRGAWAVWRFKRVVGKKGGDGVFEWG